MTYRWSINEHRGFCSFDIMKWHFLTTSKPSTHGEQNDHVLRCMWVYDIRVILSYTCQPNLTDIISVLATSIQTRSACSSDNVSVPITKSSLLRKHHVTGHNSSAWYDASPRGWDAMWTGLLHEVCVERTHRFRVDEVRTWILCVSCQSLDLEALYAPLFLILYCHTLKHTP